MEGSERLRRVEATPRRPGRKAGEVAMLHTPSLVVYSGPVTLEGATTVPAHLAEHDGAADEEVVARLPSLDALHVDDEYAAPVSVEAFTAGIVASAADAMAMLAEQRVTRPMALRASREARILTLADTIFACGERAVADLLAWWMRVRDEGDPWSLWPPVFVLGLVEGPDGLLALERLVEALRPEDVTRVEVAAHALAVIAHPGVIALAEDLLDSPNPLAQAIGLEALSRRGQIDLPRLMPHVDAREPALLAAALRALARVEHAPPPVGRVLPFLRHPDPSVAWEAARAVTLWGAGDALDALRARAALAATLGARAVELFVMAGEAGDVVHIEALMERAPLTPELLDAIGRFGNPLAWSFLIHFLIDRELCEAAEAALLTLFGPLVQPDALRSPSAWREALAQRDLDPNARYRRGEPWAPATAHLRATHSQRAIERWLDELAARTGLPMSIDLSRWKLDMDPTLLAVSERVLRVGWTPGAWSRVTRERRGA